MMSSIIYPSPDLELTRMNELFTLILANKVLADATSTISLQQNPSKQYVSESFNETVYLFERGIQIYMQITNDERRQMLIKQNKSKKFISLRNIMDAIEHRQQNMIQRAEFHMEQMIKIIFQEK